MGCEELGFSDLVGKQRLTEAGVSPETWKLLYHRGRRRSEGKGDMVLAGQERDQKVTQRNICS